MNYQGYPREFYTVHESYWDHDKRIKVWFYNNVYVPLFGMDYKVNHFDGTMYSIYKIDPDTNTREDEPLYEEDYYFNDRYIIDQEAQTVTDTNDGSVWEYEIEFDNEKYLEFLDSKFAYFRLDPLDYKYAFDMLGWDYSTELGVKYDYSQVDEYCLLENRTLSGIFKNIDDYIRIGIVSLIRSMEDNIFNIENPNDEKTMSMVKEWRKKQQEF